jgi:hypothetical protein
MLPGREGETGPWMWYNSAAARGKHLEVRVGFVGLDCRNFWIQSQRVNYQVIQSSVAIGSCLQQACNTATAKNTFATTPNQ